VSSGSRFASLYVKDLQTSEVRLVSSQCGLPGFALYPLEWVHQTLAWAPDGSLYFVEQSDEGALLRRYHSHDSTTSNVTGLLKSLVFDLYPSPDGTRLAYLLYHDRMFQVRERDVATGAERVMHTWPDSSASEYQLRGWTGTGALVAVRRLVRPAAEQPLMEVFVLEDGRARRVATVPGAYAVTARLSAARASLLYTAIEGDVPNVYELPLSGGTASKLTTNDLPGRMFSGIEPLADGSLVYAVNERRQDIWLSRVSPRQEFE
jgi:hypothetical protein